MTRRAAKVDNNQPEVVRGLRHAGATVIHLHMVGDGCGDVLAGIDGVNYLLEIKTEDGKLTEAEEKLHASWRGQVAIVHSVEEALRVIGR